MTDSNTHPDESSSTRENHITVFLDARTGASQVVSEPGSEYAVAAAVRDAIRDTQQHSGVRLTSCSA